MSELFFGLLMFICIVPVTVFMYFNMYPINWKNKKRIYGVANRSEYKGDKESAFIDVLNKTHRKQATIIMVALVIISVALFFVPTFVLKTIIWTIFAFIDLFVITIPYVLGNSEMKRFKKNHGIISDNLLYADTKTSGCVHGLNIPMLVIANIIGAVILLISILADAGILPIFNSINNLYGDAHVITILAATFVFTNVLFLLIAFIVDNSKNEVISENSEINVNYNRAKKKVFADYSITITWVDNIAALITLIVLPVLHSEILILALLGIYLAFIMIGTIVYAIKRMKLDERYEKNTDEIITDDDDYWILGMLYYNPRDKRLNIEKRVGVGYSVNLAHPAGMMIGAMGILSIIASILVLIWIGMMAYTPINVYTENNTIICHHLWDEYKIESSNIVEIESGELSDIKAIRTVGTGLENVAKGTFSVNGEAGCKLFLNPQSGKYIKIVTNDKTYYISDNTADETEELYRFLLSVLG